MEQDFLSSMNNKSLHVKMFESARFLYTLSF